MNQNTCSTCEHWTRFSDKFDVEFHGPFAGKCASQKFVYEPPNNKLPADCLEYWDAESYSAGFHTGQDFGCIHWKKQGSATPQGKI